MATCEEGRVDFCCYCLSCDRGSYKYNLERSPSLKYIFQVEELFLCYVCRKLAQNAEEFIQKVVSSQKMFRMYGVVSMVDTATLDFIRRRMQPLRHLSSLYLDLIHISPEDADNCTEQVTTYSGIGEIQENDVKVKIELEKLPTDDDYSDVSDDDILDPNYFDMKDDLVTEEVDLKKVKKETDIKKARPKKIKREERDDLMEEIKHETKPKENKPKDFSYVEVVRLSPAEQLADRAAQASSKQYLGLRYKCELCIKGFNLNTSYKQHMKKHKPSYGEYECDVCKIRIVSIRRLEPHLRSHSLHYRCKICSTVRANRKSIRYHYSICHATDVHKCPECGSIQRCQDTLLKHINNAHAKYARAICDHCQTTLSSKHSLQSHLAKHHPETLKTFECEQCEKRFLSRSHLMKHMLAHTDKKPFYCVECDKSFKSSTGLNYHYTTSLAHVTTKELRHPCPQCDKRFANRRDVQKHMDAKHRDYRPFKCDKCDKAYGSECNLSRHNLLEHEDCKRPRLFPCQYCDKIFDRNQALKIHTRIHTGEKPYQCDICLRRFTQPNIMISHRNLVHFNLTRSGQPKPSSC